MATPALSPALLNLAIPLIGMQVSRKIPFDDPQVLLGFRFAYIVSALLCLAAYYVASLKIKKRDDTTVLKYVEPKAPMSQEPGALVTTTNRDYDLGQCSQGVRGVLFGIAMMGFLHLYMKYDAPLFLQSIMPLKAVFDNKVIKIHLLGKPATGDLKRPFKAGGLMAGEAQTDAKSIKDAEKTAAKTTKKELSIDITAQSPQSPPDRLRGHRDRLRSAPLREPVARGCSGVRLSDNERPPPATTFDGFRAPREHPGALVIVQTRLATAQRFGSAPSSRKTGSEGDPGPLQRPFGIELTARVNAAPPVS